MQIIASYLMYFPRLYITYLTLLSKLSERERGRTYYINIQTTSCFKQKYTNKKTNLCNKMKKKLYGYNHNNYLHEDVPIMCFYPRKITFLCYDILHVHTKSSGKFNFLNYFFDNISLLLRKHP